MAGTETSLMNEVRNMISSKQACCFSLSGCDSCQLAENKLKDLKLNPNCVYCDREGLKDQYKNVLQSLTNQSTFPFVFINGQFVGGCDDLCQKLESGALQPIISGAGRDVPVS